MVHGRQILAKWRREKLHGSIGRLPGFNSETWGLPRCKADLTDIRLAPRTGSRDILSASAFPRVVAQAAGSAVHGARSLEGPGNLNPIHDAAQ